MQRIVAPVADRGVESHLAEALADKGAIFFSSSAIRMRMGEGQAARKHAPDKTATGIGKIEM
jgi:hypothetical protein